MVDAHGQLLLLFYDLALSIDGRGNVRAFTIFIVWLTMLVPLAYADEQLEKEIQPILDRMAEIYREDPNGSRLLFDELWLQDENILYLSEQFVNAFYGYGPVAAYWKPSWNTLYGYRELYTNLRVTLIAPGIALATMNLQYDMHAVTRTPLGGVSKLTLLLRKQEGDWKIQQFYETPMSLLSQARLMHEAALDPEFADYARAQNPQYDEFVETDASIAARKDAAPWAPRPRFRLPNWDTGSGATDTKSD
jgi:hypothetical protein